jgi:hypothetical protein
LLDFKIILENLVIPISTVKTNTDAAEPAVNNRCGDLLELWVETVGVVAGTRVQRKKTIIF